MKSPYPHPVPTFRAPGRVNLMGDHTDYNQGLCLPVAIDEECVVTAVPATGERIVARSAQLDGEVVVAVDGTTDSRTVDPGWGGLVAGVVRVLAPRVGGELPPSAVVIQSTVPVGSGLSSSSAMSVALMLALADAAGLALEPLELARLARAAEVAVTGVEIGLMDQLASVFGREGHALLVDCRDDAVEPVPIAPEVALLVVHCGLPRTVADSEYAARRAECQAIAARLGVGSLRDVTAEQVVDEPRARHVVSENGRVRETATALADGDLGRLGPLFLASHQSLRDDYGVSTRELDVLVDALVDAGASGARLTGAGFGGCVVAVAPREVADAVLDAATALYEGKTGIDASGFVATSARGAGSSSARTPAR
jgi:galactokinase